jgi:branched-chain amino acid transport system ATP-binding protein
MLEITGLGSGYRNFQVLRNVDLTVQAGSIVCLLGANGAGKSTLLKTAFGLLRVSAGKVVFAGKDVTSARSHEKVVAGMRLVPQEGNVFPNLPVEDNLRLGAVTQEASGPGFVKRCGEVYELFPILRERRQQPARVLSGGERQMLAVSIALMTNPRLLLLDEPSAGLAPMVVSKLFDLIRGLRDEHGKTILLVEQNVNEGLRIADRACVLEEGQLVFDAPAEQKDAIIRKLWRLN